MTHMMSQADAWTRLEWLEIHASTINQTRHFQAGGPQPIDVARRGHRRRPGRQTKPGRLSCVELCRAEHHGCSPPCQSGRKANHRACPARQRRRPTSRATARVALAGRGGASLQQVRRGLLRQSWQLRPRASEAQVGSSNLQRRCSQAAPQAVRVLRCRPWASCPAGHDQGVSACGNSGRWRREAAGAAPAN